MYILHSIALALMAISTAQAAPTLVYPLADQLPPVARIGKEFVFDLLAGTFNTSSSTEITFTTSTLPTWLTFDSPTQTFYGTPASVDEGQQNITLTASDGSGTTTSAFSLIVTNYSSPAVHQSFYTQISAPNLHAISSASPLPGGTGVSIPPYWSFSLGFQYDTFRTSKTGSINDNLFFQAHTRGGVGLPTWLDFSNTTFTFDGVAPAQGSWTIVVTGTDFWGHTGAQTSFVIEVGQGEGIEIAKGANLTDAQTVAGSQLEYVVDLSGVIQGGESVTASDVVLSLGETPYSWLSLDSTTNTLSGTTPKTYQNGTTASLSVPLNIASSNASNTLYLTTWLGIDVLPYFFSTFSLPNTTATPSQAFAFDFSPYVTNSSATVNATVSPTDAASWLTFNPKNMSLYGTTPASPHYNAVNVTFEGVIGDLTATTTMLITLAGVTETSTTSGTAAVPTATSSSSGGKGISTAAKIAMGVCLGLLLLVSLILLLVFCCCRRRKNKDGETKEKDDDGDSFVATSPVNAQDPFRRSNTLDPPRNLLGEIARFSGFNLRPTNVEESPRRTSYSTEATMAVEKPTRLDGLKGIFGWAGHPVTEDNKPAILSPQIPNSSSSFVGYPDVIGINDPSGRSQGGSSFTQSFASESSRASWESRGSFQWSSGENGPEEDDAASLGAVGGNRISTAESIPRPRPNFTPRYPRHENPSALARLASMHEAGSQSSFSEFHASHEGGHHGRDSMQSASAFGTGSNFASDPQFRSGSSFPAGPSGLSRFGESQGFRSNDTDDEDGFSVEGPAVVAMAERQSFETRRPQRQDSRSNPRLKAGSGRIAGGLTQTPPSEHSREAIAEEGNRVSGAFDDAEDARRSMYASNEGNGNNPGLGYPAAAIYLGSPYMGSSTTNNRDSITPSEATTARASTIRPVPARDSNNPLSPPLPQVGSFIRHRRTNTAGSSASGSSINLGSGGGGSSGGGARPFSNAFASALAQNAIMTGGGIGGGGNINDNGRVMAIANETFSIHPTINPPPTVSLSAATWSSAPPSTYRAELEGGGNLPQWLHFDSRELELWGVPPIRSSGDLLTIRLIERLPRDNRRSDPMSFGYEPPQEREVGRVIIEITDRMKSPQFALEGSPHAM